MLKYAALLFNTIALLLYQFFFADVVTITQNIPSNVQPGEEFIVELVINKGNNSGFAKLQQELPVGFTAVKLENGGGTFTFSDQLVKFIWMSLPSEKEFKVRYKVKVAANQSGEKILGGKFSYIYDNVKQSVEISPATITIGGSNTAPIQNTTENDSIKSSTPNVSTEVAVTEPTPGAATGSDREVAAISLERTLPPTANTEFKVDIKVNKGNIKGFAKLIENIPVGFTALEGESAGGSFNFNEQKVKFIWVSLPAETEFTISYKIIAEPNINGKLAIDGIFTYLENDETKKFDLAPSVIQIGNENIESLTASTPAEEKKDVIESENESAAASLAATNIPSAETSISYKIQVAALKKSVEASTLAKRIKISLPVSMEMQDGFTKYTVGNHGEYKDAKEEREKVRNMGVEGPFVTAYNAGQRISVQEALMISKQKWYR